MLDSAGASSFLSAHSCIFGSYFLDITGRQRFLAQRLSFHFFLESKECAIFIIYINQLVKGIWRDFAGLNAAGAAVRREFDRVLTPLP